MATYNLFGNGAGPSTPANYTGNFVAGTQFAVAGGGKWLTGYRLWVASLAGSDGFQPTGPQKFALWSVTGTGTGSLVPAGTVTSGTLTAGAWNTVMLTSPVQLAPSYDPHNSSHGSAYIAACGINGPFPSQALFGASEAYAAGIINGPLTGYSDSGASLPAPYGMPQGIFTTSGSDPSLVMPGGGSTSDGFFVDVIVSDTAPAGYAGSYRLWPSKFDANSSTGRDSAVNYDIDIEFRLAQPCTLNRIWHYSPSGSASLPTAASVWSIATGLKVATNTSPAWLLPSGSAASAGQGWCSCAFTGAVLGAGSYRGGVYNSGGTGGQWGATDNASGYWDQGAGVNGITNGPLSAPPIATASTGYNYNASDGGATPPYSDGTQRAAQSPFGQLPGGGDTFPQLVATGIGGVSQNYWVDVEVTPVATGSALMAVMP